MALFKAEKETDWVGIEREYREGLRSNRAIAADYGVTEGAIRKQAKAEGWIKGEAHAVRARAVEIANERATPRYIPNSPERVEALAQVGADILVRHRKDAAILQSLVQDMAAQLHDQTHHERDLAEALTEFYEAKAANNPLLAAAYKQQCNNALHAIGLNNRSKTLLNLANAQGKLVEIERKSWNLDEDNDQRSYEDLLAEIGEKLKK